jgi:hypothetical protein
MIRRWVRLLSVLLTTLGVAAALALVAQPANAAGYKLYSSRWYQPKAYCQEVGWDLVYSGQYRRFYCQDTFVAGQWLLYVSSSAS